MNTSDVLNKAADLIEERGWKIGMGWPMPDRDAEPLCLEGGIMAALGEDFHHVDFPAFWACPAYRAVMQYLGRNETQERAPGDILPKPIDPLWRWNDTPFRTAADVVETLRAAAIIAAAQETDVRVVAPEAELTAVSLAEVAGAVTA